jgi:hypothetical protein
VGPALNPLRKVLDLVEGSLRHGQRTSNLFSRQDFGEEVGVPAGDLHFAADAFFHRVML